MITTAKAKRLALDCFEGINERDMDRAVAPFNDDSVFEFIGAGPQEKGLRGRKAIAENFARCRDYLSELFDPKPQG